MPFKFNPLGITFSNTGPSGGGGGAVSSVNGQTGAVQVDAVDVPYDNTTSGLVATDVQAAIDEIVATPAGSTQVEYRSISAGENTAKQLTLTTTPADGTKLRLGVAGAPTQVYGTDFTVSTNILSWTGTSLDGILSTGDQLCIVYET